MLICAGGGGIEVRSKSDGLILWILKRGVVERGLGVVWVGRKGFGDKVWGWSWRIVYWDG